eukprot:jgi/Ulvmu1/366/UM001_0373.1
MLQSIFQYKFDVCSSSTSMLMLTAYRKGTPKNVLQPAFRSAFSTLTTSRTHCSAMATVGVVTTVGCPYCKKAKAALKEQGVQYQEAELGTARDILAQVKETTGQGTVPQIFIGGEFIGGASELLDIIKKEELTQRLDAAAGKAAFPNDIATLIEQHAPEEKSTEDEEVTELRKTLKNTMPRADIAAKGSSVQGISAADLTSFLTSLSPPPADTDATIEKLLLSRVIAPLPGASAPSYQLTDDARPASLPTGEPLNCHIEWYGSARSAVEVSGDLRGRILELYDAYLASDGKAVDYDGMSGDPRFNAYVDATVELTKVDVSQLSRDEKMAFFINVYNTLIVHGTVTHGVPKNIVARIRFFGKVKYVIGGTPYTADDIEHGILRSNAIAPASIGALLKLPFLARPQFKKGDPRREFVVSPVDPRIHFALVCGAKSCPPIKLYTPDNLDEGLQDAGSAFCEGEVEVDMETRTVLMSSIFKWYGSDFAKDDKERLTKIAEFCSPEKKQQLLDLSTSDKSVHLKYKEYDWSVNSK